MDKNIESNQSDKLLEKLDVIKNKIDDAKTSIIGTILLLFIYPVGFFYMWGWTNWSIKTKIFLSLPVLIFFLIIFSINSITQTISKLLLSL
ncbi:MAG: hypothetical protein U0525_04435 [Patescibacteria group bacterium]